MNNENFLTALLCLLMIGSSFEFNYLPNWFSNGFTIFCNLIGWCGLVYTIGYVAKEFIK